ncbi:hypothetical protein ACFL1R_13060 [Candidatus Latescibacterota bacterium]
MSITRRELFGIPLAFAFAGMSNTGRSEEKKKIAVVITAYYPVSHADGIVGRLLDGYYYNGKHYDPRVQVVSMYVDQFPDNDMSRDKAAEHGIKIFSSIREALTMGDRDLAVDGVVLIGEHGNYPWNEKGQHLYPRYNFYKQIIEVFRESGRAVPVFTDKHLSYDWDEAKWMYDQAHGLNFPLMAGSSLPLTWRFPPLELEFGIPVKKVVALWYGGKESYGFHALEMLQCMVERRKGGETGIASVRCLEGLQVWEWTDANPWAERLLERSLACCPDRKSGSLRDNVKEPILFLLEYDDGLQAALYRLNGHLGTWAFAADINGNNESVSTQFWVRSGRYLHSQFSGLVFFIEQMMLTGQTSYQVERTLLTTGALAALMKSSFQDGRLIEKGCIVKTPYLTIPYRAPEKSLFTREEVTDWEKVRSAVKRTSG